jgi:hypothetical protein
MGGGPGVEPRGLPLHFKYETNNQIMSDTWRPRVGPRVLTPFASYRTRVTLGFDGHQPTKICHVTTVRSYGLYGPATSDCTDWYSQHLIFFACLAWRTDRDIFSIRSPFDKVNIPPESGRRDDAMALFSSHSEHFEN